MTLITNILKDNDHLFNYMVNLNLQNFSDTISLIILNIKLSIFL